MTELNELKQRLASEKAFHDAKYGGADLYPLHYKANPTLHVYRKMQAILGCVEGKRVLEYGCGEGWSTRDLAAAGAIVDAFDISEQGVSNTMRTVTTAGFRDRCTVRRMAAEELDYGADTFDVAVGFAILHHLSLKKALLELHRVLRPGGRAIFAEPLGTNPLLNLYRRATPQYRTLDEEPLVLAKFAAQAKAFQSVEHHECYLAALASLALLYVPIARHAFGPVNRTLCKIDDWLLPKAGPLRAWAWYSIIVLTK